MKRKQLMVKSGQFRTHVLEAGREGAPVVVMLHDGGLGADALVSWDGVISELEPDFHIFAPDLFGFGQSDMLFHFGLQAYESHIDQIAQVAHELKLREAHFIGTSYGGSLLMRAAAQVPARWPMLSGVSISGAGGLFRHEEGKKQLAETRPTTESIRDFVQLVLGSGHWAGIDRNVERRVRNALTPGHWETLAAPRFRGPLDRPAEPDPYPESLAHCPVHVLVVEGSYDSLLEDGWASRIAAYSPKICALELQAGHSPNLDNPALVAQLIRDFVANPTAPPPLDPANNLRPQGSSRSQ